MADSSFSVNKVLGWLKKFLSSMTCPIQGWRMDDVKVNEKGDVFSSYFQFTTEGVEGEDGKPITDIKGNPIQLKVLMQTDNAATVFNPIFTGLNKVNKHGLIDPETVKEIKTLLSILIGDPDYVDVADDEDVEQQLGAFNSDAQEAATDISYLSGIFANLDLSYAAAKKRGANGTMAGGLLGADLSKIDLGSKKGISYGGRVWSWGNIASDYLTYSLECSAPGKDYGGIGNQPLNKCSTLIAEYLVKSDIIVNADEVDISVENLILPILGRIQARLGEYLDDAIKKYPELTKLDNLGKQDTTDPATEAAKNKAPETKAVFDKDDPNKIVEYVDVSTPDGQAHLDDLLSQGYSIMKSKQIKVTLKKIQGSTDFDILSLESNYDRSETLDDLDEIIVQDEFIDSVTEDPQTYTIDVDDNGYDIGTCELCEANPCESLEPLFKQGITLYQNLYILHWMAKGNDMMKLHTLSEELYGELIQEIDTIGELLVEKCGAIPQPGWTTDYLQVKPYEFQESLDILKKYIQDYIDCLDYAYPNQTSDVQSTLDEWLRYWNKQLNYFVKGQEV